MPKKESDKIKSDLVKVTGKKFKLENELKNVKENIFSLKANLTLALKAEKPVKKCCKG